MNCIVQYGRLRMPVVNDRSSDHRLKTVRTLNYVSSHREGSFLLLRYLYGNDDGENWLPFTFLPPLQPLAANLL